MLAQSTIAAAVLRGYPSLSGAEVCDQPCQPFCSVQYSSLARQHTHHNLLELLLRLVHASHIVKGDRGLREQAEGF